MNTPKFIEGPNTVQTSLYGYDRNKKVQFQLNNLRGKPIVVLRSDTSNTGNERAHRGPRGPKKWVDRSNQMPAPIPSKPMYPSYAHLHHQYSISKQPPSVPNASSSARFQNGTSFLDTAHERRPRRQSPTSPRVPQRIFSPKLSPEDEMTVKRLFDKLAVSTPPPTSSINSFFSNVSSDITRLELTPKMSTKMFVTTSISSSPSETDSSSSSNSHDQINPSFLVDTPKSLSHSRANSCSCDSANASEEENDEESVSCLDDSDKPKVHTCPDSSQCDVFRNGDCVDDALERKNALDWYNDLIQWRHDVITRRRFGPPRCHPPPLTVTIIGASRAPRANPFQRIGDVHPFAMEAMDHVRRKIDSRRTYRLVPTDLPLPPPHEFMANAKCMEPHLFIEYCYQLTAAAYIDTGLNPPNRRPPIPPPIDPIPDQTCRESICSSASEISSDGEYSDDSDDTKKERLLQKMERHRKRERRLQTIFRRNNLLAEIDEEDDI